jgi:perosamine synthetase
MKKNNFKLAIDGGPKTRAKPMPYREQFGKKELNAVTQVFKHSWKIKRDFGYQGIFEKKFSEKFIKFIDSKGFCDVVNSGTSAVYLCVKSLNLKPDDEVIVSPVSNPGGIMPVALNCKNLVIPDSSPNSFNISPQNFEKAITTKTKAAVLTHLGGHAIDLDPILKLCKKNNIKLIEDCSQAHGTEYKGRKVGTLGDFGTWSTMFSKTLSTGGIGGIIFTKNKENFWKIRSLSDRGKPFNYKNFYFKDTEKYLYPSLNFNSDELACAIGASIIDRLPKIILQRRKIAKKIDKVLLSNNVIIKNNLEISNSLSSLYFHTIQLDFSRYKVDKSKFIKAIELEGIDINGEYKDIACEWNWIKDYTKSKYYSSEAIDFRNNSINILFNEKYKNNDIMDICDAIIKVHKNYIKN